MISRTGVCSGSLPGATQRVTMSRSVTMPRSLRFASQTGSAPRFVRFSSRAAALTGSSWPMLTTRLLMISLILID